MSLTIVNTLLCIFVYKSIKIRSNRGQITLKIPINCLKYMMDNNDNYNNSQVSMD